MKLKRNISKGKTDFRRMWFIKKQQRKDKSKLRHLERRAEVRPVEEEHEKRVEHPEPIEGSQCVDSQLWDMNFYSQHRVW